MRVPRVAFLSFWLAFSGAACAVGTPKGTPDELMKTGRARQEKGKHKDASRYYKSVTVRHPESEEAEEALYLLGEAYRVRGLAQNAFETYKRFVDRYPNSPYSVGVAAGEYQLGIDHFDGKIPGFLFFGTNRRFGVRILEHMQINFRNHSKADDALVRVAGFHLGEQEYSEATEVLKRLLAEYPRTENMLWARFQLARALWLQNLGPDYDDRLLDQSRRAFEDFIGTAKLMGEAERHKKRIATAERMIRRIDDRQAEKNYRIGRFYERTGRPRSAAYYYRYTLRTFPGTPSAKRSQERLGKLGQKT